MKDLNVAAAVALLAVACSAPTLDGTDSETFAKSVTDVRDGLDEVERSGFDEALQVLMFKGLTLETLAQGETGAELATQKALQDLNGMTAAEVIAKGDAILAERRIKEREQALEEIQELQAKADAAESATLAMARFEVLRSRFSMRPQPYGSPDPMIEISVRNGTEHPISRAYFRGVVASPGRAVPWIAEDFNYSIKGGLEPGEEQSWSLGPNKYSGWGTETPPEAVFTVEVVRLDGADGEALFDSTGLTDYEEQRLDRLKEEFLK